MAIKRVLTLGVGLLALTAAPTAADYPLSKDQIIAHVSGNTLGIVTENLENASAYFSPDGAMRGKEGGQSFSGSWSARGDLLCMDLPRFTAPLCRTLVVRGDTILFFTETGEPAGRIEVTKGNPDGY